MNQKAIRPDDQELIAAASSGDLSRVQQLLQVGADIHADNDYALRLASGSGHVEVVKLLLDKGANIHANDDHLLRCYRSSLITGLVS